eukprot:6211829-Pleurochrysis_carterae.AAC.2
MAEPSRTTAEAGFLTHPPSPGQWRRRERIEVGRGPDEEGGLTPRAGAGVASAPLPRRPPRGQGTDK